MQVKDIMRTDYLEVEQGSVVSETLGKMQRGKHTEAVVVDNKGKCLGLFDKRALLKSRVDICHTKVQNWLIGRIPMLSADYPVEEAARLLMASDKHILPVIDKNKKLVAIVGARDVLEAMRDQFDGVKAGEVGSSKTETLQENAKISVAMQLLNRKHIGHIPIVDAEGKLLGVLSLIDILTRLTSKPQHHETGRRDRGSKTHTASRQSGSAAKDNFDVGALPVMNLMTTFVVTASPKDNAGTVLDLMHEKRICDVILVEKGKVAGIVTTKDLLGWLGK